MSDLVVTVPRGLWASWIAEGDLPGQEAEYESHFMLAGPMPDALPGDRVYVVSHGRLRGYAPLVEIERRGHLWLGTLAANSRDRDQKGRSRTDVQATLRAHPEFRPRGERNGHAKLTPAIVQTIRSRYAAGGISQETLASEFGVARTLVSRIVRLEAWVHVS